MCEDEELSMRCVSGWCFGWEKVVNHSLLYSTLPAPLFSIIIIMGLRAGKCGVMIPQLYLGKVGTYFTFYGVRSWFGWQATILKYLVSDTSHKWVLSRRKWIFYGEDKEQSRADSEQVAVVEDEGTGKIGMDPPLFAKRRQTQPNPSS